MKKISFFMPLLFIALAFSACQKENMFDEKAPYLPDVTQEMQKKKHPVPFRSTYTSAPLVFPPQPNADVCGVGDPVFNFLQSGSGNATHMGCIDVYISSCIDPTTTPFTIFNGEVTFTAANGDLLYFTQDEDDPTLFNIVGGTGRFDDATGWVIASFEPTGSGPTEFINYMDGEIQY